MSPTHKVLDNVLLLPATSCSTPAPLYIYWNIFSDMELLQRVHLIFPGSVVLHNLGDLALAVTY